MSAAVVFILFVICLVIAIPVSISLGIVAVLPGAFDSSFTASASYVIRSMLGGIDSFPLLAVPMFVLAGIVMAHGKISQKLFDVFVYFIGKPQESHVRLSSPACSMERFPALRLQLLRLSEV